MNKTRFSQRVKTPNLARVGRLLKTGGKVVPVLAIGALFLSSPEEGYYTHPFHEIEDDASWFGDSIVDQYHTSMSHVKRVTFATAVAHQIIKGFL